MSVVTRFKSLTSAAVHGSHSPKQIAAATGGLLATALVAGGVTSVVSDAVAKAAVPPSPPDSHCAPVTPGADAFGSTAAATPAAASSASSANPANLPRGLAPTPDGAPGAIVGIGDSLLFTQNVNLDKRTTWANDYSSFIDMVGNKLNLQVFNYSQPGESTKSVDDVNARNNGGWTNGPIEGSRVHDRGLHQTYADTQLRTAINFIKEQKRLAACGQPHVDVQVVDITLGGNNMLFLQDDAKASGMQVPYELLHLPGTLLGIHSDIEKLIQRIRSEAGYDGLIVVTNQYAVNYSDTVAQLALKGESEAIGLAVAETNTKDKPVRMVDFFKAMGDAIATKPDAKGDGGKAGYLRIKEAVPWDLYRTGVGTTDYHATEAGNAVLGQAELETILQGTGK